MTTDQLKSAIYDKISHQFPDVAVAVSSFGKNSGHLLAEVFGADPRDVRRISSLILDIDIEVSELGEFAVTPVVVDLKKTMEMFPQRLPACVNAGRGLFLAGQCSWVAESSDAGLACAANEELALAA